VIRVRKCVTDPDTSISKKKRRKDLEFYRTVLLLQNDWLPLKAEVNVPTSKETVLKSQVFSWQLESHCRNEQAVVQISGSIQKITDLEHWM
jgi:hypothetical protein